MEESKPKQEPDPLVVDQYNSTLIFFEEDIFLIPDKVITQEQRDAMRFASKVGHPEHECFYKRGSSMIKSDHPEKFAKTWEEAQGNTDLFWSATKLLRKNGRFYIYKRKKHELRSKSGSFMAISNVYVWNSYGYFQL
jgi:hypothetical protein